MSTTCRISPATVCVMMMMAMSEREVSSLKAASISCGLVLVSTIKKFFLPLPSTMPAPPSTMPVTCK